MPQCPTCGGGVSEEADVCPNCGMDLKSSPVSVPEVVPVPLPVPPDVPEVTPLPPSTAPGGGLAQLTLKRSGALTSETFPVGENVVLGRFDPDTGPVDVDLGPLPEAAYVSRHHAQIWRDESGQWFIKDLGARNGTFVRSPGQLQFQRVTDEYPIQDGDEIALGNARFEFRIGA